MPKNNTINLETYPLSRCCVDFIWCPRCLAHGHCCPVHGSRTPYSTGILRCRSGPLVSVQIRIMRDHRIKTSSFCKYSHCTFTLAQPEWHGLFTMGQHRYPTFYIAGKKLIRLSIPKVISVQFTLFSEYSAFCNLINKNIQV